MRTLNFGKGASTFSHRRRVRSRAIALSSWRQRSTSKRKVLETFFQCRMFSFYFNMLSKTLLRLHVISYMSCVLNSTDLRARDQLTHGHATEAALSQAGDSWCTSSRCAFFRHPPTRSSTWLIPATAACSPAKAWPSRFQISVPGCWRYGDTRLIPASSFG